MGIGDPIIGADDFVLARQRVSLFNLERDRERQNGKDSRNLSERRAKNGLAPLALLVFPWRASAPIEVPFGPIGPMRDDSAQRHRSPRM